MKPIGLTMKHGRNKYRLEKRGELMLVHQCVECGILSMNRIAADDDPSTIFSIFQGSLENPIHATCEEYGIVALTAGDANVLYSQLYGGLEMHHPVWK